jgi:D-serine deaminase-like pyridoxal phosphate-dependent protein
VLPGARQIKRALGAAAQRSYVKSALADLGNPGSRYRVATPAAIIDLDALDHNIGKMADDCRRAGIGISPHAKAHKSAFIAYRQLARGAARISCAKVAEAEALFAQGIQRFLITSPIATADVAARAAMLARQRAELLVVVDHPTGVDVLARAARAAGSRLGVLVDTDVGDGRTGTSRPASAVELAARISSASNLSFRGIQAYGGFIQHLPSLQERRQANRSAVERLRLTAEALGAAGYPPEIRTGGGTGSFAVDVEAGVLNDVQPGSYIFMDREYRDAFGQEGAPYRDSLFVQSTVVSVNAADWVTVDAGVKAFATNGPLPPPMTPPYQNGRYEFFGDEFGKLKFQSNPPPLGTRIEFQANHCDPTIDRYDLLHVVSGDVLVAIVPVDARGRSQ